MTPRSTLELINLKSHCIEKFMQFPGPWQHHGELSVVTSTHPHIARLEWVVDGIWVAHLAQSDVQRNTNQAARDLWSKIFWAGQRQQGANDASLQPRWHSAAVRADWLERRQ